MTHKTNMGSIVKCIVANLNGRPWHWLTIDHSAMFVITFIITLIITFYNNITVTIFRYFGGVHLSSAVASFAISVVAIFYVNNFIDKFKLLFFWLSKMVLLSYLHSRYQPARFRFFALFFFLITGSSECIINNELQ